jgi:cytochrome c oxidase subunit 2
MPRSTWPALAAFALTACSSGSTPPSATTIDPNDPVIAITAHQWAFSPDTITLNEGASVTLDLVSTDVHHGFNLSEFGLRADVLPEMHTKLRLVASKKGTFTFFCDYYCGGGHEDMTGTLVVK